MADRFGIVFGFGSLHHADHIETALDIVADRLDHGVALVVCAPTDINRRLSALIEAAVAGRPDAVRKETIALYADYRAVATQLTARRTNRLPPDQKQVDQQQVDQERSIGRSHEELARLLQGIGLIRECSPRAPGRHHGQWRRDDSAACRYGRRAARHCHPSP